MQLLKNAPVVNCFMLGTVFLDADEVEEGTLSVLRCCG